MIRPSHDRIAVSGGSNLCAKQGLKKDLSSLSFNRQFPENLHFRQAKKIMKNFQLWPFWGNDQKISLQTISRGMTEVKIAFFDKMSMVKGFQKPRWLNLDWQKICDGCLRQAFKKNTG